MPSHCHCQLRLAGAGVDTDTRRIASLALRSSLNAMTSALRLGRYDWRSSLNTNRHASLASRRSLRIAGSLRIAVPIALAYRPRRLARIAATPARVTLATHRPARFTRRHACGISTARWRARRCRRIACTAAAHRAVPIAPIDRPRRLARIAATPARVALATHRPAQSDQCPARSRCRNACALRAPATHRSGTRSCGPTPWQDDRPCRS